MSSITGLISGGGGGGGGTPVNGIGQLYLDGALSYTDELGQVWLKTGNIIAKDTVTYPDATFGLNLAGATYSTSFSTVSQEQNPRGLAFSNDGTKMFIIGTNIYVYEYALSTAFDVSTASFTAFVNLNGIGLTQPEAITFNNDGTKMYIVDSGTNDRVWEFNMSAFDVTSVGSYSALFSIGTQDTVPAGIAFSNDGTRMFIVGSTNDAVYQYNLSTAFSISTGLFAKSFSVAQQEFFPSGISLNEDGTRLYVVGYANRTVFEYILGLPFDIGEVSIGTSLYVGSQASSPRDITFNNDATKMYVVCTNNDAVYEYSIPEAMGVTANTGTYDYVKLK